MNLTRRKLWISALILLPVFLVSGLLVMSLFSKRPDTIGLTEGKLQGCPPSPNCVCSCEDPADSAQFIDPLTIPAGVDQPMETLIGAIESFPRTKIITREDHYLHVEFTTRLLRFVDDVEFQIVPEEQLIHIRSASRIGYSDLGANRKRVEQIRAEWSKATRK
jgi:uncharacterized protein (DUF1499 family)